VVNYKHPQFAGSKAHILYTMELEHAGNIEIAEAAFKMVKARLSNFESRCQYGSFLQRVRPQEEARYLFARVVDEAAHLGPQERSYNRAWIGLAKVA